MSLNQTIRNVSKEVATVQPHYEAVVRNSEANNQSLNEVRAQHYRNLEWTSLIENVSTCSSGFNIMLSKSIMYNNYTDYNPILE